MRLFDTNILIYAHRKDQSHHDFYRGRLEEALAGSEVWGLTPAVVTGFVRIVTQPTKPIPFHRLMNRTFPITYLHGAAENE